MTLRDGLENWMLMETIRDPTLPSMILQNVVELSEAEIYKKVEKGSFYYLRQRGGMDYAAVYIKDSKIHPAGIEVVDDFATERFCEMVNEFYPDVIQWLLHKYDLEQEVKTLKQKGLS